MERVPHRDGLGRAHLRPPSRLPCSACSIFSEDERSREKAMTHVPPPWIIDEAERKRRRRNEREQPRLELPRPPPPARSGEDESDARDIILAGQLWMSELRD